MPPIKINMVISNGNFNFPSQMNPTPNLASPLKSSQLNSGMISRIHNIRPGCGSCGRKG